MSDETELNPELSDSQLDIVSALRSVELPETAIDHDSVMYQSGWAAAMAECEDNSARSQKTSHFWPAMTMAFAVTTAACLMLILMPASEGGFDESTKVAVQKEIDSEMASKDSVVLLPDQNQDAEAVAESTLPVAVRSQRFGLAQWFGVPAGNFMAKRNAQFEKHLAEAASPSRVVLTEGDEDWDLEPSVPLTPRSRVFFSL